MGFIGKLNVFLHIGLVADYAGFMDDHERTPTFTADDLEAHLELSLAELEAGMGRPIGEFLAELKADFRAAYPDVVAMLHPAPVKLHSHD